MSTAADQMAALLRQDYADWATRFRPVEDELLATSYNGALRGRLQSEAATLFTDQFDAGAGETERRLSRMGLSLSPEQQAAQQRGRALDRSLGMVDAINRAGRGYDTRNLSVVSGSPGRMGV